MTLCNAEPQIPCGWYCIFVHIAFGIANGGGCVLACVPSADVLPKLALLLGIHELAQIHSHDAAVHFDTRVSRRHGRNREAYVR